MVQASLPPDAQQKSPELKRRWYERSSIPLAIAAGCFAIALMSQMGYITLPRFHIEKPGVYELSPEAVIGTPYRYDFYDLIAELPPGSNGSPYTFYLGSGVGFPPMGLVLGIDGVLKGIPTAPAGNFEVCVKDAGGRSACRTCHLTVNPGAVPTVTTSSSFPGTCPKTSCDTGTCCGSVHNGVRVSGVLTYGNCLCPTDTEFAQQDLVTAGGPYNICTCKQV